MRKEEKWDIKSAVGVQKVNNVGGRVKKYSSQKENFEYSIWTIVATVYEQLWLHNFKTVCIWISRTRSCRENRRWRIFVLTSIPTRPICNCVAYIPLTARHSNYIQHWNTKFNCFKFVNPTIFLLCAVLGPFSSKRH